MRFLFKVLAQVEKPIVVGQDGKNGRRQLIPVPSGTVEGTDLQGNPITGIVLPGAVDSQVIRPDGKCELSARYGPSTLKTTVSAPCRRNTSPGCCGESSWIRPCTISPPPPGSKPMTTPCAGWKTMCFCARPSASRMWWRSPITLWNKPR